MLDVLQRQGEVAVARREGRHRVWDLAERVYPTDLPEYDEDEATAMLHATHPAGSRNRQGGRPMVERRRHGGGGGPGRGQPVEVPRRPRGDRGAR